MKRKRVVQEQEQEAYHLISKLSCINNKQYSLTVSFKKNNKHFCISIGEFVSFFQITVNPRTKAERETKKYGRVVLVYERYDSEEESMYPFFLVHVLAKAKGLVDEFPVLAEHETHLRELFLTRQEEEIPCGSICEKINLVSFDNFFKGEVDNSNMFFCQYSILENELFPISFPHQKVYKKKPKPKRLVCREKEVQKIRKFILRSINHEAVSNELDSDHKEVEDLQQEDHVVDKQGNMLFITGLTGCGKTESVSRAAEYFSSPNFRYMNLNIVQVSSKASVLLSLCQEICPWSVQILTPKDKGNLDKLNELFLNLLNRFCLAQGGHIVVLLDDVDSFLYTEREGKKSKDRIRKFSNNRKIGARDKQDQDVVYTLIECCRNFSYKKKNGSEGSFTLIAIANTLTLPDKVFIRRIRSRLSNTRMAFQVYSFSEIKTILSFKAKDLNQVLPNGWIEYVSRTVEKERGDVRLALKQFKKIKDFIKSEKPQKLTLRDIKNILGRESLNFYLHQYYTNCSLQLRVLYYVYAREARKQESRYTKGMERGRIKVRVSDLYSGMSGVFKNADSSTRYHFDWQKLRWLLEGVENGQFLDLQACTYGMSMFREIKLKVHLDTLEHWFTLDVELQKYLCVSDD
eukprot:snap_masked-scaffold_13-processed-gene-8.42-mRNA-1 protein AED:1.00 eAED:1.00 QI:0/-1/0/0/-1/1/1/0/630